ncbi:class I SAM-dependent methyltransferase [Mesobacillus maritimus]|uniref:class I SAM-dependent methyltransferase n=1 Tax=Mesobacillus maritimus TaxID=1643336 RepID=UPI0032E7F78C
MERLQSWNVNLYDSKHSFVSMYGADLIEILAPKPGERILDLGCGTGDLTKKIYDLGAQVVGVDQSEKMIHRAKEKYPHHQFLVQDATNLAFYNEFDAVFSNATLHWVTEPEKALASIYQSLKPNGRFVAEFGGKGNVQFITSAILQRLKDLQKDEVRFPWYYPSIGEYTQLMEKLSFRVTFAQHFDRPTKLVGPDGLRNWIKMFGDGLLDGLSLEEKELLIIGVENHLKPQNFDGYDWLADYKRIRVIGIK